MRENYNLAASAPLTATPNRESRAEPLSPTGETSARSAVTLRAGAQLNVQKALKGCGGKQEFSPTSNTLSLLSLSSETVRWTVFARETQLGGLPKNLQCKCLKISESTKSIEKKGI